MTLTVCARLCTTVSLEPWLDSCVYVMASADSRLRTVNYERHSNNNAE